MRYDQVLRLSAKALLIGWAVGSTGCVHNHYYYPGQSAALCEPAPGGVVTTYGTGAVCEVPAGGAVIAQSPGQITTIGSPSRVVINSEPMGRPYTRGASRFPWRRSDSEVATARLEGGINEEDARTR